MAKDYLNSNGKLYFEINEKYGEEIKKILEENSFKETQLIKDLNNKDRFVVSKKSK